MEKPKRLLIDLCCGLKGSSQAFEKNPNWEVITLDIERKFKPTIIADVCHLPFRENLQPTLLLASPECAHFSLVNPRFPRKGIQKAMEMVGACFEAVATLKPKFWLIENPRGRLRHLALLSPNMTIFYSDYDEDYPAKKPTDLWSNIPLRMVDNVRRPKGGFDKIPCNSADRSKIPRGVSSAFQESVESCLT